MHDSDSLAFTHDQEVGDELVFLDASLWAASAVASEPTDGSWCVDFEEAE
jgi:hypothetical protein